MDIPKEGLRFECQETGRCCALYGSEGYVILTPEDAARLEKHLGQPKSEFTQVGLFRDRRGNAKNELTALLFLKDSQQECRFLKNRKCTVYEARPTQCRTFPFWEDNFEGKHWKAEVIKTCKGIGKGKLYSKKEVMEIIETQNRANRS